MTLREHMVFRRHQDVVHAEIDDECVLMHVRTGLSFALDPRGFTIWRFDDKSNTWTDTLVRVEFS